MHGYNAKDMARSFRTVRNNTIKIAEEIPAEKYGFKPGEGSRTVAQTLAHVAVSPRFSRKAHGERITEARMDYFMATMQELAQKEATLQTKDQIVHELRTHGDEFANWLETLSDEVLAEQVHFVPPIQQDPKTRFEMLLGVKEHEMHHRAQLMVIERMLGIVPHLTREQQERMAAMQAAQQQHSAGSAGA